ncbi:MAG: NUDIX hydrolase [Pseudomonadota bacterium]
MQADRDGPDAGHQENCLDRLNAHFKSEVRLFSFSDTLPQLEVTGALALPPELQQSAARHRDILKNMRRPNELHAILAEPGTTGASGATPDYKNMPPSLQFQTLDFAGICALREHGRKPAIVSACAVLVCVESREIILHRRSANAATAPGRLHTIGGAYLPPSGCNSSGNGSNAGDSGGLADTVLREIAEETGLHLQMPALPTILCSQELATGFLQFVFLGIPVPASQLVHLRGSWEGSIVRLAFDDMRKALADPGWVPSGKAHVLAWLALGASGPHPGQTFGGLGAAELFHLFTAS